MPSADHEIRPGIGEPRVHLKPQFTTLIKLRYAALHLGLSPCSYGSRRRKSGESDRSAFKVLQQTDTKPDVPWPPLLNFHPCLWDSWLESAPEPGHVETLTRTGRSGWSSRTGWPFHGAVSSMTRSSANAANASGGSASTCGCDSSSVVTTYTVLLRSWSEPGLGNLDGLVRWRLLPGEQLDRTAHRPPVRGPVTGHPGPHPPVLQHRMHRGEVKLMASLNQRRPVVPLERRPVVRPQRRADLTG